MNLRLKPTIIPYKLSDEVVLQVGGQYARIPDENGANWALTKALDGTRTANEVVARVLTEFPESDVQSIRRTIDDYIKYDMVEIPEEGLSTVLSENLRTRFSRNFDFFGSMLAFGENKFLLQERLLDAKVCVLGCGGLGTHILYELAAVGIQHLTILDFDKIELSNLNRQILYKEEDIGSVKVETAKRRLLEFNSNLKIRTYNKRLESTDDIASVVKGHDIVICVADKPANYIGDWLNAACVAHRVPFITGGLDVRRSVFFSVQPGVSGCEECWLNIARSKNATDNSVLSMNKTQNITYDHPAPAFVPLVAVTAGMIVSEAVKYITKCQPPQLTNKLKEFCFDELTVGITETWERDPGCKICGESVKHFFPEKRATHVEETI